MESTSYVLSFRMVFFYLVTTGWIFLHQFMWEFKTLINQNWCPHDTSLSSLQTQISSHLSTLLSRPCLQQAVRQNTFAKSIFNANYSPWEPDSAGRHVIILCIRCDSPTRKNTPIIAHEKNCYQGAKILSQHIVTVVTNVTVPTRTTDVAPSVPPNAPPPRTHKSRRTSPQC